MLRFACQHPKLKRYTLTKSPPSHTQSVFVEQFREKAFPDVFGTLNKVLGEREWLEQGRFTVSDLVVG